MAQPDSPDNLGADIQRILRELEGQNIQLVALQSSVGTVLDDMHQEMDERLSEAGSQIQNLIDDQREVIKRVAQLEKISSSNQEQIISLVHEVVQLNSSSKP